MSETTSVTIYLAVDHEGRCGVDMDSASDAAYNLSSPVYIYELGVKVNLPNDVHSRIEIDATRAGHDASGIELGSIKLTLPD